MKVCHSYHIKKLEGILLGRIIEMAVSCTFIPVINVINGADVM